MGKAIEQAAAATQNYNGKKKAVRNKKKLVEKLGSNNKVSLSIIGIMLLLLVSGLNVASSPVFITSVFIMIIVLVGFYPDVKRDIIKSEVEQETTALKKLEKDILEMYDRADVEEYKEGVKKTEKVISQDAARLKF